VKTVPLRSVATVLVSNVDKKSVEGQVPVRLCNYTDVYYEPRLHQRLDYMAATATADQRRTFGLRVGDTVITKDSETADDIGAAALVTETAPDFVCGYHLAILRPGPALEPRYLHWQVASRFVQEQLATRASGVTRYGLTYDAIRSVRLVVPPAQEQRRIADFLDDQVARLDGASDEAHQVEAGAAAAASERLRQLVASVVSPSVPLSAVAKVTDTEHKTAPEAIGGGHWSAGTGAIRRGLLLPDRLRELDAATYRAWTRRGAPRTGDVLLTREAPVGEVALLGRDDHRIAIGQRVVLLRPSERLVPSWLLVCLLEPGFRERTAELTSGSLHPHMNMADIARIRIPLPDVGTQETVAREGLRIEVANRELQSAADHLARLLEDRKRALITACVTGEFDISTASSRAADAALRSVG
jgi:type I restriction enzyme S subunit